jgi:hypothetical protein
MKLIRDQQLTHTLALDLLARTEFELGRRRGQQEADGLPVDKTLRAVRDALAAHVRSGLVRRPRRKAAA